MWGKILKWCLLFRCNEKNSIGSVNLSRRKMGRKVQPMIPEDTGCRNRPMDKLWEESIYPEESFRAFDGPSSFYWFHGEQIKDDDGRQIFWDKSSGNPLRLTWRVLCVIVITIVHIHIVCF